LRPFARIVEKEMYTHFLTFHTEFTYAILFPFLLVWTMELGIGNRVQIGGVPYIEFIAPGIMLMSVLTTAFFNTGFIILFEKEYTGSFDGLITCPVSSHDVVFGKILAGAFKSVITGIIIIVVLVLAIGFRPPWTAWLCIVPIFIASLLFSAVGLAIGVMLKKGYQLGSIGNMLIFPLTFFGGIFFDVATLPANIATAANLSPVTMVITDCRNLMIYGSTDGLVWHSAVGLLFFVFFYFIAERVFVRQVMD